MTSQVWADSQPAGEPAPAAETRWLDAEEQKTWRAWLYSTQLLQDRLDRELTHSTGISHAYYEILVALSEAPERMCASRCSWRVSIESMLIVAVTLDCAGSSAVTSTPENSRK